MRLGLFVLGVLVALQMVIGGCGSNAKSDRRALVPNSSVASKTSFTRTTLIPENLAGIWTTKCLPDPTAGETYMRDTLSIHDGIATWDKSVYFESSCSSIRYRIEKKGPISVNANGTEVVQIYKSIRVTSYDDLATSLFNRERGYCGETDWQTLEPKTIDDVAKCGMQRYINLPVEYYKKKVTASSGQDTARKAELFLKFCEDDSCEVKYNFVNLINP